MQYDTLYAKKITDAMSKTSDPNSHRRLQQELQAEMARVEAKHGSMISKTLWVPGLMLMNSMVFISMLSGVGALVRMNVPSLLTGGTLWFTNLTLPDPYFGLPALCTLVTFLQLKYSLGLGDSSTSMASKMSPTMKMGLQAATLLFLPAGAYVSTATALLWVSNSGFSVMQGFALRSPGFRARVGLPSMEELAAMSERVRGSVGMGASAAAASAKPAAGPGLGSAAAAVPPPPGQRPAAIQPAAAVSAAGAAASGVPPAKPAMVLPGGQRLYAKPPKRANKIGK